MALRDRPIKQRLMVILLLTSGVVLLLTSAAFVGYEYLTFRQATLKNLSTLADIIAANSTASVAFANEADATETLAALRAEQQIVAAALYDKDGRLLSRYPEGLPPDSLPRATGTDGYRFEESSLVGFRGVVQGGNRRLGTLYLKADMTAVYGRFRLYGAIAAGVMGVSLLVAYLLSSALQGTISHPILALAETAQAVSERQDYSVRAPRAGQDEIGLLTDAFNTMLGQIEDQHQASRVHITEQKLAAERLRETVVELERSKARVEELQKEEKERFRVLIEAVKDYAILVLDPDGRVATWNSGAERLKGYRRDEIVGQHFSCFYPADAIAQGKPERELQVAASEGRVEDEGWRVRKDGSRFWANVSITALRDEQGRLLGFGMVARDMTERRRVEEELTRSNAALEAFSYSVAHDLRAPLRAMDGFSQALFEDYGSLFPAEAKGLFDVILQSTKRMGQMIEGLLSFSRLGQKNLDLAVVDSAELARSVVEELRAGKTGLNAEVIWNDLPTIRVDRTLMRQVLANLIGNALKFSRDRPNPRVEIGARTTDGEVVFQIRDNGAGFDPRYADKLFGVFQRLHAATEFEGTGVGLALVRRIVERHHGRVWAESQPGAGATFYFTFPQG